MSKGEKIVLVLTALLLCATGIFLLTDRPGDGYTVSALPEKTPELTREMQAQPLVDLNSATAEELMTLPGIGETRAQQIIDWRQAHGAFAAPEDVLEIPGIGEGLFAGFRDYVTVDGTQ